MGHSLAWLAIRGKPAPAVHRDLGLAPTGNTGLYGDHPMVGIALPSGWFLLVSNNSAHPMILDPALSHGCEMIACSLDEHVMYSNAEYWQNGQEIWSITHDAQHEIMHLEVKGEVPEIFEAVRARLASQQEQEGGAVAETDYYFDIPLETARQLAGFRHDVDDPLLRETGFMVFAEITPLSVQVLRGESRPWWRFW